MLPLYSLQLVVTIFIVGRLFILLSLDLLITKITFIIVEY